jgi:hypothetical protein
MEGGFRPFSLFRRVATLFIDGRNAKFVEKKRFWIAVKLFRRNNSANFAQ